MSLVEAAARELIEKVKIGVYCDKDIHNFIKVVKECDADPDGKKAIYREEAIRQYQSGGDLEFDKDAIVSLSDDGGAYVQCWKYVYTNE